jgi:uncharacterized membrane protein
MIMDQNNIVTETSKNLRALGRMSLKGKWGLAVGGTVIMGLMSVVPSIILNLIFGGEDLSSGFSSLYSILITGPLALGYAMFGISIFRGLEATVAEVFYGFERFLKSLGLYLLMNLFIILWAFPAMIGAIVVAAALGSNFDSIIYGSGAGTIVLAILFLIILCIPAYIAYYRYCMSFYILADHPEIGPLEAIRRSKTMMKGNKWKFFCLQLSFIGWVILSFFTFCILLLWITPYMEVSVVAFYDLANGSLRAVKPNVNIIQGESLINSAAEGINEDPITVYKEEPASETPAQQMPALEHTADEEAAAAIPAQEVPNQESPAQEAPNQEAPVEETPKNKD